MMGSTKVKHLAEEILAFAEHERQELAEGVLPELGALVEHARRRNRECPDRAVAAVMDGAIQAARRARRS